VETADAVEAMDEIAQIPYVDGFIIGPMDMSGSVGQLGHALTDPETNRLIETAIAKAHAHGLPIGLSTGANNRGELDHWIGKGIEIAKSFVKDKIGPNIPFSVGVYIPHNAVLVFDDLERICSDKITPVEVLGLINSYAEHHNKKVIIVCNESEFSKHMTEDNHNSNGVTDFCKYKDDDFYFMYEITIDPLPEGVEEEKVADQFWEDEINRYEFDVKQQDRVFITTPGVRGRAPKKISLKDILTQNTLTLEQLTERGLKYNTINKEEERLRKEEEERQRLEAEKQTALDALNQQNQPTA
jgi:hypothetical protein